MTSCKEPLPAPCIERVGQVSSLLHQTLSVIFMSMPLLPIFGWPSLKERKGVLIAKDTYIEIQYLAQLVVICA